MKNIPDKIRSHFEEPLFSIAIFTCLLTITIPFLGGWMIKEVAYLLFILSAISAYFVYLHLSGETKEYILLGIPLLMLSVSSFVWWSCEKFTAGNHLSSSDFTAFSMCLGIALLFYALWMRKIITGTTAVISVLFLSTLLIHLVPAFTPAYAPWSGKYLSALDPYFYYRHANTIVETGYVPEYETLIYPGNPPSFANSRFMVSVLMGSFAVVLGAFGFTVHDIAMIYPGVFSAFIVVMFYVLLRELFSDMEPNNQVVATLGAFMLMLSQSFATKAIATNCEDDTLGMFLLVSSFMFFVLAFRRKSLVYAILSGFSFLLLNMSWAGYSFAIVVFGIFGSVYAIINFIHKKNCVEHIPYFAIPLLMSLVSPLVLHARGEFPSFGTPPYLFVLSFGGTLVLSFLLEMIRQENHGRVECAGIDGVIQRNVYPIGGLLIVGGILFFIMMNPTDIMSYVFSVIGGAKTQQIIGMTTAEQNVMCNQIDMGCVNSLSNYFGDGIYIGLLMIPVLLYFMVVRGSFGAAFVLSWSLPMMWGVINKVQYQFTASVPIVALVATVGLIVATSKESLQGLRVIPVIILVGLPMVVFMYQGGIPVIDSFGGATAMHMGAGRDRVFWQGTFDWLGEQPDDVVVLTWWDYGHWIAGISNRMSILDNTKADGFMVQDIAKFHVLVENESEALDIARKYGATHVIIDWTMIGKSGAPHFIATSNLTGDVDDPKREGSYAGYGQCGFSPGRSSGEATLTQNDEGGYDMTSHLVFECNNGLDLIFNIVNGEYSPENVYVMRRDNGQTYPWIAWRDNTGASVLGVQSLKDILYGSLKNSELPGNSIFRFDTYRTLVYVPKVVDKGVEYDFNKVMITKLYLGDYLEEYQEMGLADPSIEKSKYFRLVEEFRGNKGDNSQWGYVRVYEVDYLGCEEGVCPDDAESTYTVREV